MIALSTRIIMTKKERIAHLEHVVDELTAKNDELLKMVNVILRDIRDLQQFKCFVERSQPSTNAALTQNDAK